MAYPRYPVDFGRVVNAVDDVQVIGGNVLNGGEVVLVLEAGIVILLVLLAPAADVVSEWIECQNARVI